MDPETTLLYIADPMCSWCWGFAPQWSRIRADFPALPVRILLGGLAPDTEEPMPLEMQTYVQLAWDAVERTAGVSFDRGFWDGRNPDIRRATYPACRAVILARKDDLEAAMFDAIQHAYYQEARNPSNPDVLADCATAIGMTSSRTEFLQQLDAPETQALLEEDLQLRRSLGANTFPSLAVVGGRVPSPGKIIHRGWGTAEELLPRIEGLL